MREPTGYFSLDAFPRAGRALLQAQGDLLLLVVDVQDLHFDFLVDRHHFGRMIDPSPAHVGDVQQAVDAAEVDERAELGDVLDDALAALAHFQLGQQLGLLLGPLGLDQRPAADDDVPPRLVDLQHQALDGLADVVADVGRTADVDLAGRQKDVHADVDQQPALDLARGHAGDDVALVDGLHHLQPGLDLLGLALAEGNHAARVFDQAVDVFHVFDEDLDLRAGLGQLLAFFPFVAEDDAFALVADVDQDHVALDAKHAALDDLVQLHLLGSPGDFLGRNALQRGVKLLLPFFLAKIQSSYQVAVDHKNKIVERAHTTTPRSPGPSTSRDSPRTIGESSSIPLKRRQTMAVTRPQGSLSLRERARVRAARQCNDARRREPKRNANKRGCQSRNRLPSGPSKFICGLFLGVSVCRGGSTANADMAANRGLSRFSCQRKWDCPLRRGQPHSTPPRARYCCLARIRLG